MMRISTNSLLLVLLFAFCATTSARNGEDSTNNELPKTRGLEQENWDNVNWVSDDYYADESGSTILSNWTKQAHQFEDRLDEDLVSMWETAPSAWIGEYWEVFVAFLSIGLILMACYCMLCCSCCCGGSTGRRVVDTDEYQSYEGQTRQNFQGEPTTQFVAMEEYKTKEETQIPQSPKKSRTEEIQKVQPGPVAHVLSMLSSDGTGGGETSLLSEDDTTARYDSKPKGTTKESKKKTGSNMLMEVVDVWSEFLVHQFDRVGKSSPHRRKRESDYRRDASQRSMRSPRNSTSRRSPKASRPKVERNESLDDSLEIV